MDLQDFRTKPTWEEYEASLLDRGYAPYWDPEVQAKLSGVTCCSCSSVPSYVGMTNGTTALGFLACQSGVRIVALVFGPDSVNTALTAIRRRDTVENPEFAAFAARILRACARRVADGDVDGLAALVALRSELDTAIAEAVTGLRQPAWGYSWSEIARVLGTTRQAAQQPYSSKACG